MPKNYESSKTEMHKTPEAPLPSFLDDERSPDDLRALDVRRKINKLIDEYEITRSKYELALLTQKKAGPPTEEQIQLKNELQTLWDTIHGEEIHAELRESEILVSSDKMKKTLALARKEIAELPRFTGQEYAPIKKDMPRLQKSLDESADSRESIKKSVKEKIRSKDQIKKLRVKLAKLKSAFAGAYKMSPARAIILLSQPTGFLGALKGLADGKMPSREERKKLSVIRSQEAQELLKDIQNLETNIDKEWKKAKKEEALIDANNSDVIDESELDETISLPTLRESFTNEIKAARDANDDTRAEELKNEIYTIYNSLKEHFPELIRRSENDKSHPDRTTILPSEPIDLETADTLKDTDTLKEFTPPTARDFQHEEKVILPEVKSQHEAPTIRAEGENKERSLKTEYSIEVFGGGEAGRKYAADLWDHANKIIQEKGGISLQGEKGKFKDALDYVHAFAEKTKLSSDILGQQRSGEIWQEIFDHKTELLKSPSMDDSEKAKLESLDPIYYVTQSALRDKALQDNDLDAAAKHNEKLDEINKLLGYPKGMNPSTGEGMGKSPQKETRGLGKNRARSEMARTAEKVSGISAKTVETGGKKREIINDTPYSIEWAARLLPNAKAEWDKVSEYIKEDASVAKKEINGEIRKVTKHVKELINSSEEISNEYHGINKLPSLRIGDPAEATRYVMLKAASELTPVTEDDKKLQVALVEAVSEIDRKLMSRSIEKAGGKENIKNQIFKTLDIAGEDVKKAVNPDLEKYFTALNDNNEIKIRSLLGNVSRKLRKNGVENQTIDQVKELLKNAKEELQQAA
ncbi:MAG: hypothetical protein P1P90_05155 [Patescibacteria group bacterium]|nr:hypothetical protein [Patescibacteria group bacterium]